MKEIFARTALFFSVLSAVGFGCARDLRTARGVAEAFLDEHYVRIDLQKAKEYTIGLALQKVDDEIRLTSGQLIDASTRKPRVHYRFLEKRESLQRATFVYEGTIQVEDAPVFTRRWMVTARKEGERWLVSNFTEYD